LQNGCTTADEGGTGQKFWTQLYIHGYVHNYNMCTYTTCPTMHKIFILGSRCGS
jgi:hypothetical protein